MFRSDPIGLPGLAVLALGFVLFLFALFAARARRGAPDAGTQKRSRRSWLGIVIQGLAIASVTIGNARPTLDPLGFPALAEAAVIAILMAFTIGLFVAASRAMGQNWSLVARTRSDHTLVTTGPFAHVRHPIYSALFLFMLALAIGSGNGAKLLWGIPLYAIGTWLRIAEEERLLHAMFGGTYDAYAGRVKRFVPGVF